MKLNNAAIAALMKGRGITQNQLARLINVQAGSLSNALSGRKGCGRKILSGLLTLFPNESVASLTVNKRQVI
ncbi:putative transcription regulator containing HTH domain [Candidatus Desulfosporosinus infrequens]|uniref:Putative transcription regulator containing HTH domain n=1 Tax=Candidatus Desulfosporosinus infrequens TaxID=2043169 RepID=A0A2U3LRX0_9FIRM|nr:putative transcription regulator containing HTH domain [Candidatus Desulfosporosinus infrequens]